MPSTELRHYFTSGFFADAQRPLVPGTHPELMGTEIRVAQDLEERLKRKRRPVLYVELGGQTAASAGVLSDIFEHDILAGNLMILVTNKERRQASQILKVTERLLRQSRREASMIPDLETAAFVRQHAHLIQWKSGVDTKDLPRIVAPLGGADIIHECMAGLFFHPDRPKAFHAVVSALNPGGRLYTRETPDRDFSYGKFPHDAIKPDHFYVWGIRSYRMYTKTAG